ncbi:MAG: class IIb bacteriocin, lactobin A/cerein 7B family [Tannerellaceae bacterium]|jgi:lactobin A/cerein 7B family class IIb bacteriocin|nr:class IIb bacteriocin, lactobin A/cerein 7B family [Tannerellaceae bacterium]
MKKEDLENRKINQLTEDELMNTDGGLLLIMIPLICYLYADDFVAGFNEGWAAGH